MFLLRLHSRHLVLGFTVSACAREAAEDSMFAGWVGVYMKESVEGRCIQGR